MRSARDGKEIVSLIGSTKGEPASARFSPDGSRLASGTLEGPVIIWAIPGK